MRRSPRPGSSRSAPTASTGVYTFVFIALTFAVAFVYALQGGPRAIRILLIAVIAIAPLRGAILALADAIDLPNAYLPFNAIQPSLIAGLRRRGAPGPPLAASGPAAASARVWLAIAARLRARLRHPDRRAEALRDRARPVPRLPDLRPARLAAPRAAGSRSGWSGRSSALGVLVAVSIFLEVGGRLLRRGGPDPRRLGGVNRQLPALGDLPRHDRRCSRSGALFARWSPRNALLAVAAVGVMVGGMGLTYSRGGFGIAIVGALVLLVVLRGRDRLRLVGVAIAATAIGLALELGDRPERGPARLANQLGRLGRGRSGQREANRGDEEGAQRLPGAAGKEKALGQGPRVDRQRGQADLARSPTRPRAIRSSSWSRPARSACS